MLWPVVCSAAKFAASARWPIEMMEETLMRASRSGHRALHAQGGVDDARELVGVGRVGRVAGLLQARRESLRRRAAHLLHRGGIARALRNEARVVLEGLGIGAVRTELLHDLLRLAADVLGGRDVGHRAVPAGAGLDA